MKLIFPSTWQTEKMINSFPGSTHAVASAFLPNLVFLNFFFCRPLPNLFYMKCQYEIKFGEKELWNVWVHVMAQNRIRIYQLMQCLPVLIKWLIKYWDRWYWKLLCNVMFKTEGMIGLMWTSNHLVRTWDDVNLAVEDRVSSGSVCN